MARGYNRIVLMGNLARDADVRFTPQKQKCAKFTVACGREWKNKRTNEKESQTDFINCVAWGTLADVCERYTSKGKPVLVEGRLSVRTYDKDGQKRWITEVVAENIVLLSGARPEDTGNSYQPKAGIPGDLGYSTGTFQKNHTTTIADTTGTSDESGFDDEFPLDFSDMGNEGPDDVSIPF